ncbi:hypothetical protein [Haloarchaeobius sp. DFWS5]|uniref:hypothetical protein n=1 Tax=Haloarchaeobius sp. DFWS5 TaxID=3446114 RepID=UPI003EBFC402
MICEFDAWNTQDLGSLDSETVRSEFPATWDRDIGAPCGPGPDTATEDRLRDLGYF